MGLLFIMKDHCYSKHNANNDTDNDTPNRTITNSVKGNSTTLTTQPPPCAVPTGQSPPCWAATGQFDHPRRIHESKGEPLDQPQANGVVLVIHRSTRKPKLVEGSENESEEACLQQKDVPGIEGTNFTWNHPTVVYQAVMYSGSNFEIQGYSTSRLIKAI